MTTVPASIDATGQTDVTDALCEWVNNLTPGTYDLAPGRYRCEGGLHLVEREGVVLRGNGAAICADTVGYEVVPNEWNRDSVGPHRSWPVKDRAHLRLLNCVDTHVHGLRIEGPNDNAGVDGDFSAQVEGQHAIKVEGGRNVVVSGIRGGNVHGDLVYVAADYPKGTGNPDGVLLCDLRMENAGRHGFGIVGGDNVQLSAFRFRHLRRAAMDFEPGRPTPIRGLTVEHGEFRDYRLMFLASDAKGDVSDVVVRDVLADELNVKVRAQDHHRTNWHLERVVGCRQFASTKPLMQFFRVDGLTMKGCYAPLRAGRAERAVMTVECADPMLEGNVWPVHMIGSHQPTEPPRQGEVRHFDDWADAQEAGWN